MIAHSRRVVALATPDKVGRRTLAGICSLASLTDLVMTGPVPDFLAAALREREVRLHEI
jgi:DeoR family transcriptional regulator of aga operon